MKTRCPGCMGQEKILWKRFKPAQLKFHCTTCDTQWDVVIFKYRGKPLYGPNRAVGAIKRGN